MSAGFRAVQWNRAKLVYDAILVAAVALYIGGFIAISAWIDEPDDLPGWIDLRIRACGTCAFIMLTVILSIVVAYVLHIAIEKPLIRTGRSLSSKFVFPLLSRRSPASA